MEPVPGLRHSAFVNRERDMQQLLIIKWSTEVEYIKFDEDDRFPKVLETWSQTKLHSYVAAATFRKGENSRTLELVYKLEQQTDPKVTGAGPGEIRFGKTVVIWNKGDSKGKVKWEDDSKRIFDGPASDVDVLYGQPPIAHDRQVKSVLVKQRPEQNKFRDKLLKIDEKCVISGECCREALQAAHIIPVADEGYEQINNGSLLRADLHLLFDAGLIWFDVSENRANVNYSKSDLTDSYKELLKNKTLPPGTFWRVEGALKARAELPGGRGRT